MSSLMLMCGGKTATLAEVCEVEVPEGTETYRPVPHGDLVRLAEKEITRFAGLENPERHFGLGSDGNRMFGVLSYSLPKEGLDLSAFGFNGYSPEAHAYDFVVGLRNSYDKSMSGGLCGGASCGICDNLMFHGELFTILAHHTKNVWTKIRSQFMLEAEKMVANFGKLVQFQESMKGFPVDLDDGYRTLGLARGRGLLTPTQLNVGIKEWRTVNNGKKEHPFSEWSHSSYALYQTMTEALKIGGIERKMDQYTGVSDLFEELNLVEDVEFMEAA